MKRILLVAVSLVIAAMTAFAQGEVEKTSSEGKEFWLCFMKNFREAGITDQSGRQGGLRLQLFITSSYDATVRIEVEGIQFDNTVSVKANTVVNVSIPAMAQASAQETAERLAVHITADQPVSVYGLSSRFQTTDTYLGLPVNILGTEYRAVCYTKIQQSPEMLSGISIVATEDGTEVTIVPRAITSTGRPAGIPFKVRLSKGDVYTVVAKWEVVGNCDLTGTSISSNKKVSVFSGHACAYIPPKVEACNHLIEQMPPTNSWGKHYYIGMLKERSRYTYRVIASADSTKVFEDSKLIAILKAGEFYENLNAMKNTQITASKPVMVAQFAQGFKNGDSVGDPMMILVTPTQQFRTEYRFATPINGDWHHYINVIAPRESIRDIRLNGRPLDTTLFRLFGESRYAIGQVQVPFGTHVIKAAVPFGLYSYGFGFLKAAFDAYGNMAGQSFYDATKLVDSLPPDADDRYVKGEYQVIVRDDRITDKGLRSVSIVQAMGLEATVPYIDEGAPQAVIKIRRVSGSDVSSLVLKAVDAEGNSSVFSVCHLFDNTTSKYVYNLSSGMDRECKGGGAWHAGVYLNSGSAFHRINTAFSAVSSQSKFNSDAQGTNLGLGAMLGYHAASGLTVLGSLSFSSVSGDLLAPDTTRFTVLDTVSRTYVPYQEADRIRLSLPYLHTGLGLEYSPRKHFYLGTGIQLSMLLSNSIVSERIILRPSNHLFPDGSTVQTRTINELPSLNSTLLSYYGSVGVNYPVSYRVSVFAEARYTQTFGDLATETPWTLETFGLLAGARYRF
ncbi:MAG: hypothetical protein FGM32_06215 [Candidatus Kapabacteria bacterium]|nr:hypothetical protein [Candidatus Kapabacteria bacterium]